MITPQSYREQFGKDYYIIDDTNEIIRITERLDSIDSQYYRTGNYYHTPLEAEAALRLRSTAQTLDEAIKTP